MMRQPNTYYHDISSPHDNIIIPIMLSLLIHGCIIAFVIYHQPKTNLDITSSIETTIITPEELAQIQGQISANRDALSIDANPQDISVATTPNNDTVPSQPVEVQLNATSSEANDSVFVQSNTPPDDISEAMRKYNQKLQEKQLQFQQMQADIANELDKEIAEEMRQQLEYEQQQQQQIKEQIKIFKQAANQKEEIEEKNRQALRATAEKLSQSHTDKQDNPSTNISLTANSTNVNNTISHETAGNHTSEQQTGGRGNRSSGDYHAAIIAKIQRYFTPPIESQNKVSKLSLQLDQRGNVLSAKASGTDKRVNEAAEKAAFAASPLPIDPNNPSAFSRINITVKGSE